MRYIITHTDSSDASKPVRLVTYAAELADSPEQAIRQFTGKHPDHDILDVTDAPDERAALMRYGMGAWTDEEREDHRAKLHESYAVAERERDDAKQVVSTYEPEEFAAAVAYLDRRAAEQTPNLEGVHVGDLFYVSWGYEQTNYNFFQVVGLRGKHTIIVRENERLRAPYGFMCGLSRPIRNRFDGEERYTVRTRIDEHTGELRINAPKDYGSLRPCKDGQCFDYTSYA